MLGQDLEWAKGTSHAAVICCTRRICPVVHEYGKDRRQGTVERERSQDPIQHLYFGQ